MTQSVVAQSLEPGAHDRSARKTWEIFRKFIWAANTYSASYGFLKT
jgi:hypothetical protein